MLEPWWKNFFYNMATVQFDHRLLAWMLAFLVPVLWWQVHRDAGHPARARAGAHLAGRDARRADRARHRDAAAGRAAAARRGAPGRRGAACSRFARALCAHALPLGG